MTAIQTGSETAAPVQSLPAVQQQAALRINEQAAAERAMHREKVTSTLAYIVMGLFAVALVFAFWNAGDTAFAEVKDILSILTPIVGMVLGFYFTKSSTEGRAESAEQSAKLATGTAQQAVEDRTKAEIDAQEANNAAEEVATAAEELLQSGVQFPEPVDDAINMDPGAEVRTDDRARLRLEEAVKRARRRRK
jgi:hypothetical protein